MDKLLHCPFCGSEAETFEASEDSFSILCTGCGVETPYLPYLTEAIAAWNRRADAVPVVRGEWIKSDNYKGWLVCSACRDCYVDNAWVNGKKWRYCPNCGAKMDGEKGEKE